MIPENPAASEEPADRSGPAEPLPIAAEGDIPPLADEAGVVPVLGPRKVRLLAVLAGIIVLADLITKIIAVAVLDPTTPGDQQPTLFGGVVYWSLIRNPGAAFSMATGMTWLLSLIVIAVVIAIIRIARKLRSTGWAIALGLVLGGALGNLIDRIFRAPGFLQGHVVDFVSVFGPNAEYFPVFNVADSAVSIGVVLLLLTSLRGIDFDGTSTKASATATTTSALPKDTSTDE